MIDIVYYNYILGTIKNFLRVIRIYWYLSAQNQTLIIFMTI